MSSSLLQLKEKMENYFTEPPDWERAYQVGMKIKDGHALMRVKGPMDTLAELIDASGNLKREQGLKHSIKLGEELLNFKDKLIEKIPLIHYFLSNAWSELEKPDSKWTWENKEIEKQIIHLRKAVLHKCFCDFDTIRQCHIYTNLGGKFSFLGRFVEAQSYWDQALKIIPSFGMALGSKSEGLCYIANVLFDKGHNDLPDISGQLIKPHSFSRSLLG